jgi:tetratricopeptide (TPR) repeat protein
VRQKNIRKNKILASLLITSLGVFVFWLLLFKGPGPVVLSPDEGSGAAARQPGIYYGPSGSIAVLPFQTEALPADLAFLGTAVPAVLLRQLASLDSPQVTAGTSSFFFREERPPPEIVGQRLQVSRLLEGRFSGDGGSLELVVRIVRSRDGEELHSSTWTQPRERLPELQRQLARFVAEIINADAELLTPLYETTEPESWEAFLQGLHLQTERTAESSRAAQERFLRVVEAEPGFSDARVELAAGRLAFPDGDGRSGGLQAALEQLEQVSMQDRENGRAYAWLAWARHRYDKDWARAESDARHALERLPGDPQVLNIAALALFTRGEFEEVEDLLRRSIARDPLNLATRLRLGLALEFRGDNEGALTVYRTLASLNADFPGVHAFRARIKLLQDKADSALAESEKENDPFWRRYARILALFELDRRDEAEELLQQMIEEDGDHAAYQVAEIQARRGDADLAFHWLEKAREQNDRGLAELVGNPFFTGLAGDSRWRELVVALGHSLD